MARKSLELARELHHLHEPRIFGAEAHLGEALLARLGAVPVRDGRAQAIHLLEWQLEDLSTSRSALFPR